MNYTKSGLLKNIEEMKEGVKMGAAVLETVKKFEHRKKVDKRFTDALKELGYHAYIVREAYSSALYCGWSIWRGEWDCRIQVEFRYYLPQCFTKDFTWEGIKAELERHNFAGKLADFERRLARFDDELKEFEEFVAYVKSKSFTCFDSGQRLWDMECALEAAKREVAQ